MLDLVLGPRDGSLRDDDLHRLAPAEPDRSPHREGRGRSLKLGIITSEFPPGHGGMQEHARGLVRCLSVDHHVSVYTSPGMGLEAPAPNIIIEPIMHWRMSRDLAVLRRARVDAWITLNAGLSPFSLRLAAPLFAYVHGNDFIDPWLPNPGRPIRLADMLLGNGLIQRWRLRQIAAGLRGARWIFANSAFSGTSCAQLHDLPPWRVSVIPPGIRAEFFQTSDPGISRCIRLVTVSRLSARAERKNIDGVIEAVARLRGEIDILYTVIGDGDDLPRLRGLAAGLGVDSSVRFLGAVDTPRVIEEFGRNDAFIMAVKPSRDDVEGFGMVYAEAAASGLPSIGTRTGGIPEVIEHGVTGLLLEDVSAAGIADGIRSFYHRRTEFDRDTIRRKVEHFSAAACTASMVEIITKMI